MIFASFVENRLAVLREESVPVRRRWHGFFGAFLRLSGFETIVVEGACDEWMYLHIANGRAELKSARHLVGTDTLDTEKQIRSDFGKKRKEMSVFAIGPAGENGVRFSAIVGDDGHVAAHNGVGAVMGSKRLKAVAVERGRGTSTERRDLYEKGTSFVLDTYVDKALLPVKNLTTNVFKNYEKLTGEYYRSRFDLEPRPETLKAFGLEEIVDDLWGTDIGAKD